ncbi:MAG TPA: hypothetical protein VM841_15410, partial [Actinomycetota bacterium]|nr:hypothetical protein [Actinomycetota bacterium]
PVREPGSVPAGPRPRPDGTDPGSRTGERRGPAPAPDGTQKTPAASSPGSNPAGAAAGPRVRPFESPETGALAAVAPIAGGVAALGLVFAVLVLGMRAAHRP